MNAIKRTATILFSMLLLFTYCVSNANATESYHWYRLDDSDGMIRYFHKNNQQIDSYAEAGGTISATSGFINGKTYVENYHPLGTPLYNVYVVIAYVNLRIYCEHGTIRTRENLMGCDPTDDMEYALVRTSASATGCEYSCLTDFVTEHIIYEGTKFFDPEDSDTYYQYADTETIIIHSEEDSPNYN